MSSFDPRLIDKYSNEPGVYLMKNGQARVIYVGKAKSLRQRLRNYFASNRDGREMVPYLISEVTTIEVIVVPDEKEALLLENTLIKKHQPKYNALLKDDKNFILLTIQRSHPWPRLQLVRSKEDPKKGELVFGPYTSGYAARHTYDSMTQHFPLRQCSDEEFKRRTRPCLLYAMQRCMAPCVGKCTKQEYEDVVDRAVDFLRGDSAPVIEKLKKKMEQASQAMEYEKAGALLNTIRQIEEITHHRTLVTGVVGRDIDAWNLYREGEVAVLTQLFFRSGKLEGSNHYFFSKNAQTTEELITSFLLQYYPIQTIHPKEIVLPFAASPRLQEILPIPISFPKKGTKRKIVDLAEKNAKAIFDQKNDEEELAEQRLLHLQQQLHLNQFPERIDCFDTSHTQGSDFVASMITFTHGAYDKKHTRTFHIRGVDSKNEYAALQEAITRRLTQAREEHTLPNLIIVDGGKGQLGSAMTAVAQLDIVTIDVIAVAKEEGRHTKGVTQEQVFIPSQTNPILFPLYSPLLFLLQKIRDEAHRVALRFHRKQRSRRNLSSLLDSIPGIGPAKKRKLLSHFGTVQKTLQASSEELLKVPGITPANVKQIQQASLGSICGPK